MPLFARTFNELVGQSLQDLATGTNVTKLSAGGKARAMLESLNKRLEEVYETFDLNLARAFVSSAPGQYLDLIGQLLGVDRDSPRSANADTDIESIKFYVESGTFGDINGGGDIYVPINTYITTGIGGTGTIYRLKAGVVLGSDSDSAWASVEATVPGSGANIGSGSLTYHTFEGYTDYENSSLLVTNIHPIDSGRDTESDANYRYRITNRVLEGEAANEIAVRLAALSVPGVADVVIKKRYRGIGTAAVIIQSVAPTVSESLIDNVTIAVERVMALGDKIYVMAPKETGLSFVITIHYKKKLDTDELDAIETDLEDTIEDYVNGLDIGESFSVNLIVSQLFSANENIANLGETGIPIDEIYLYKESRLGDNKLRQKLLGDYTPEELERIIIEPSVSSPIQFQRKYDRK